MSLQVVGETVFVPSPERGTAVHAGSYYTRTSGLDMMSLHTYSSRGDIFSHEFYRFSDDNGRSWSDPVVVPAGEKTARGTRRRHARGGYLDPGTGRFLKLRNEAVLPHDEVSEFMRWNTVHYTVSIDGGKTDLYDTPLVHDGHDEDHPLPNVVRGKNCFMLGDSTCMPITLPDGALLQPVQISPMGPDGEYHNPGGGFTYTDCAVLRGEWRGDMTISWNLSGMVYGDPERSTRGLIEPTIARLADGRILMVMRGSNDARPELPGYRWYATSDDDGASWTEAKPWTYRSGTPFHSPSSCSQLVAHSGGDVLWIGNICDENPRGNAPRYPIIIGVVDQKTATLVEKSVTVIDDRRPGDGEILTLSNFYAREDRVAGTVKLHLTRHSRGPESVYQGDCMLYEIALQ